MKDFRLLMAATVIGVMTIVSLVFSGTAANASTSKAVSQIAAGRVCTVTPTAVTTRGNVHVVTKASQTCAARGESAATVKPFTTHTIGYGCTSTDFNGTCYNFDVNGSCAGGTTWYWNSLSASTSDRLSSFEPMYNCKHSIVYNQVGYSGANISCPLPTACPSLESLNHHDRSLKIQP